MQLCNGLCIILYVLTLVTYHLFKFVSARTATLLRLTIGLYPFVALLDRGWRRAGRYLYKPEMDKTCCPQYTIRLKASDFIPSKEQQRVSKRMQRYFYGALSFKFPDVTYFPRIHAQRMPTHIQPLTHLFFL